jgi:hypothetical protein
MKRFHGIQVFHASLLCRILITLFALFGTELFLPSVKTVFAKNDFFPSESMVQVTWSVPTPTPHHYRIEIRNSDETGNSTPRYVYSKTNSCALPVQPGGEFFVRIQAVTEFGKISPFSDSIIIQPGNTEHVLDGKSPGQTKPSDFLVNQNQPNPFNPATAISFTLPDQNHVQVYIFNMSGQKVATLHDAPLSAGKHSIVWDASSFPSGAYFYMVIAGSRSASKKMLLLK